MTAYLLIGEAPGEGIAARIAEQYKDCPYVHFIAAFGEMLVGVFYFPEGRDWWIKLVADEPTLTLGLRRAAVYQTDRPSYPKSYTLRVPEEKSDIAPCGSRCMDCERFSTCSHCPATHHYLLDDQVG